MKNIVIILDQAPYANSSAREVLDATMVFGVFGQTVTLLFRGAGLWHLLPDQAPTPGNKNLLDVLKAMPLYDISQLVVDGDSLERLGLCQLPGALKPDLELEVANNERISRLIRNADLVLRP